jgi:hypothetical protein
LPFRVATFSEALNKHQAKKKNNGCIKMIKSRDTELTLKVFATVNWMS